MEIGTVCEFDEQSHRARWFHNILFVSQNADSKVHHRKKSEASHKKLP